ncbi:MAG: acyl carrier protein [Erysipelotrichaceae bacterium]|nr:acyl carrier protein [Erysipelotrichaceae bacterium]MCD7839116.1 acyl carrier protein [Erysipelotrichaceae bacterium]
MDRNEIAEKVIECVSITYKKDINELSLETSFKDDLGGASILMVGLVSLIENELDVLVDLPTASQCKNINELVDKVAELL